MDDFLCSYSLKRKGVIGYLIMIFLQAKKEKDREERERRKGKQRKEKEGGRERGKDEAHKKDKADSDSMELTEMMQTVPKLSLVIPILLL